MRPLLATTGNGVERATPKPDGTWTVERFLEGGDVRCLAADPRAPGVLYAGTGRAGVLRSGDGGETWEPAGLPGRKIRSLAVSPLRDGVVYAGTSGPAAVFVSANGGATWSELEGFRTARRPWPLWFSPAERPYTAYVQAIALSPTDPDVILAGIEAGATTRSADGGRTWTAHAGGALRDCHSLCFHAADGRHVYEGGGTLRSGVAVSHDAGASWTRPVRRLDRHYGWAVAADPVRPGVVYASLSPGAFHAHREGRADAFIFRSLDGYPWTKLGGGLPQPLTSMAYALLTDAAAPDEVWAGLANGQVWHGLNRGDSWAKLPFSFSGIHRVLIFC